MIPQIQRVVIPIDPNDGIAGCIDAIRQTFWKMFAWVGSIELNQWYIFIPVYTDGEEITIIYHLPIQLRLPIGKAFDLVLYNPVKP